MPLDTQTVIRIASEYLSNLKGHVFNVLTIEKPTSLEAAFNLSKVISKLSPLLGNMIEFHTIEYLNGLQEFRGVGLWKRQDPGFPDAIFEGSVIPTPGFEIKVWFPLATEITARFKDSQNHFSEDQTYVVLLAWLPEKLIYGKPEVIDVCVVPGKSIALARDTHYNSPPYYLVIEPEDTSSRTSNLRQTNTNGYVWQGTHAELEEAKVLTKEWGLDKIQYQTNVEYQKQLRDLLVRYKYRLDTNYAKIDRIEHVALEEFKKRVMNMTFQNMKVVEWASILNGENNDEIKKTLKDKLDLE